MARIKKSFSGPTKHKHQNNSINDVLTMSKTKQTYSGNCHCGAVEFKILTTVTELTTCDCSICIRKNAVMLKVHESEFELIKGADSITEYQFHTATARHYFCNVCGIYPFHRKRVTPDYYGINIGCLADFQSTDVPVRETNGSKMK